MACFHQKVGIDVCQLFGPETVFLQQAAYLTGGSYVHLERRDAVLQYLTVCVACHPQDCQPRLRRA
jgi:hypothetical protein